MPIPDFQTLMLPFLRVIGDSQEYSLKDLINRLADIFHLTDFEKNLRSENSTNYVFRNKVGWAKLHLKKAKLVEDTERGKLKITTRGLEILHQNLGRIDMRFLSRFPEWREFRGIPAVQEQNVGGIVPISPEEESETPQDIIKNRSQELNNALVDELLDKIRDYPSAFFENLVIDVIVGMGYGGSRKEAEAIGRSHDGGIDGLIKEDPLGLDIIYVQAKLWTNSVGEPEIRDFVGSLEGKHANKGIVITTSKFTTPALEYIKTIHKNVALIDGRKLAQIMIDKSIGVRIVATFSIKEIDEDYFPES